MLSATVLRRSSVVVVSILWTAAEDAAGAGVCSGALCDVGNAADDDSDRNAVQRAGTAVCRPAAGADKADVRQ